MLVFAWSNFYDSLLVKWKRFLSGFYPFQSELYIGAQWPLYFKILIFSTKRAENGAAVQVRSPQYTLIILYHQDHEYLNYISQSFTV